MVTISNSSELASLSIEQITSNNDAFYVTDHSVNIGPLSSYDLEIFFTPNQIGLQSGELTLDEKFSGDLWNRSHFKVSFILLSPLTLIIVLHVGEKSLISYIPVIFTTNKNIIKRAKKIITLK